MSEAYDAVKSGDWANYWRVVVSFWWKWLVQRTDKCKGERMPQ